MNQSVINVGLYVGGRANYSSAKSILTAISRRPGVEYFLILGGAGGLRKYGALNNLIQSDGFRVTFASSTVVEGSSVGAMTKSIGLGLIEFSAILDNLNLDVGVAIGDRFDVLPWAVALASMNIHLLHTMGGEISGSIDDKYRNAITQLADTHAVANSEARTELMKRGVSDRDIFVTGCPRVDEIKRVAHRASVGDAEFKAILQGYKGIGALERLKFGEYLLVQFHPVTTEVDVNYRNCIILLNVLHELKIPTIMLWPNSDAGSEEVSKAIRVFRESKAPDWLNLFINFSFEHFIVIMSGALCMVGNSSSAIRDAEALGVKAVNIGDRQIGRLRGNNVVDSEIEEEGIKEAVLRQLARGPLELGQLYGNGTASDHIVDLCIKRAVSS